MIRINQIECKSGYTVLQKNRFLFEWVGEVWFNSPQTVGNKTGKVTYYGPLSGCGIKLDEIFGEILIVEWKKDSTNPDLIKGIRFVGTGVPFVPLSIEIEQEEKTKMYFVLTCAHVDINEYATKEELLWALTHDYMDNPNFQEGIQVTKSPEDLLIIKGDIVVPKPVQVVQKYEVE